jgi:isopropylmalate/homocitrate/citramalate synthase
MGERAGNANLAEIALALRGLYGVETRLRLDRIRALSLAVAERAGYAVEPFKPLVGENLFRRESGAVASQFHDPPSIEPYASELVGADRSLVLGKKSGIDSIRIKARELGLQLSDEDEQRLLAEVKRIGAERRGLVSDDELRRLAEGTI